MPARKKKPPQSAGRSKLASFGITLPLIPVTNVGSLPKNQELLELRYKVAKGVQPQSELDRKSKLGIELWIRDQERLGLDVLTDGELTRGDFIGFFAKNLSGFSPGGTVRSYGNRFYRKPIVVGKIEYTGPITVDSWKSIQRLTHRPLKAIVTGPYTLMDWSFNEHYGSRENLLEDLTTALRKEITMLVDNGARIVQIDDPAISGKPDEFNMIHAAYKKLTDGLKCYFVLHHCYGDIGPVWQRMARLPVDNFSLEACNATFQILPLLRKHPTPKDITLGLVDSHSHTIESVREVHKNLQTALKYIPAAQLWISPDCGLKTRTIDEAFQKLDVLVKSSQKIRATYR